MQAMSSALGCGPVEEEVPADEPFMDGEEKGEAEEGEEEDGEGSEEEDTEGSGEDGEGSEEEATNIEVEET